MIKLKEMNLKKLTGFKNIFANILIILIVAYIIFCAVAVILNL